MRARRERVALIARVADETLSMYDDMRAFGARLRIADYSISYMYLYIVAGAVEHVRKWTAGMRVATDYHCG